MYSGSGFVTRVLPMDDERHGDMLPRTTSLALPCTFGTDASTPRADLTLCYEHADIDGADGHADGRTDTRLPSMPSKSCWSKMIPPMASYSKKFWPPHRVCPSR